MKISSSVFEDGGEIPTLYTCEGINVSPKLIWKGIPNNAKSLALIIEDPDAPDPKAPKITWVHWVLFNIDPNTTGLPENVAIRDLPKGTMRGLTSWRNQNYGGPCPPIGRHRYFHYLYALDITINLDKPTATQLREAMEGHIIEEAVLMGTYQKQKK